MSMSYPSKKHGYLGTGEGKYEASLSSIMDPNKLTATEVEEASPSYYLLKHYEHGKEQERK